MAEGTSKWRSTNKRELRVGFPEGDIFAVVSDHDGDITLNLLATKDSWATRQQLLWGTGLSSIEEGQARVEPVLQALGSNPQLRATIFEVFRYYPHAKPAPATFEELLEWVDKTKEKYL